jgi:NAD(P)-dependent dehydrogenase (short-subunit alcohol dehydrogenase family)
MSKLFDLSGKVALVTGASSGLGAHFAKCLGAAGASVVLAARRADRLQSLQAELEQKNVVAKAVDLDVQSSESVAAALEAAGPLDIIVNNAGISIVKPALEMPEKDWDAVVDTNLRGAWLVAQGSARRWVAEKRPGAIINIGSILGLRTIGQVAPYNASKAGLIHLTRTLAMEWARYRIRVNAICPGYIETEMNSAFWKTPGGQRLIERIPQRRIGQPEHLDGALLLLASQAGTFMTGSVLTVDGGHTVNSLYVRRVKRVIPSEARNLWFRRRRRIPRFARDNTVLLALQRLTSR